MEISKLLSNPNKLSKEEICCVIQELEPELFKEAKKYLHYKCIRKFICNISGRAFYEIDEKPIDLEFSEVKISESEGSKKYNILSSSEFCPCKDFAKAITSSKKYTCKHLLAVQLCEVTNEINESVTIQDYKFFDLYRKNTHLF